MAKQRKSDHVLRQSFVLLSLILLFCGPVWAFNAVAFLGKRSVVRSLPSLQGHTVQPNMIDDDFGASNLSDEFDKYGDYEEYAEDKEDDEGDIYEEDIYEEDEYEEDEYEEDEYEEDEYEDEEESAVSSPDGFGDPLSGMALESLTVQQLKQQLRLRGLKVSGRKSELYARLAESVYGHADDSDDDDAASQSRVLEAEKYGAEIDDVSEYLDKKDKGKHTKSLDDDDPDIYEERAAISADRADNEVWGARATIVDDFDGRRRFIDSISRTIVEFPGSNSSACRAYVAASRDALKPFLAGGNLGDNSSAVWKPEERLRAIQLERENKNRVPEGHLAYDPNDKEGEEGDEDGIYRNILSREESDWGLYTVTGAQLSAQEVQGVILLSDVYGPFTNNTMALADKIAFECQPIVVFAPDVFRGHPWEEKEIMLEDEDGTLQKVPLGENAEGQTYEEWRKSHLDVRVTVDIRAAAACLRQQYGVNSVVVWGTCYGGGRALEVASGHVPENFVHDIDGAIPPPQVEPSVVVAWYPTRYKASDLFGKTHKGTKTNMHGEERKFAVMAVFGGRDELPGARREDAKRLKMRIEDDVRIKDSIVKVFPKQGHAFAHRHLGKEEPEDTYDVEYYEEAEGIPNDMNDAELAWLLSSSFMETYSRTFLPTVGSKIMDDRREDMWRTTEMPDMSEYYGRDVRAELETLFNDFSISDVVDIDDSVEGEAMSVKRTKIILMQYQKGHDPPPELKLNMDDSIQEMCLKLVAWKKDIKLW